MSVDMEKNKICYVGFQFKQNLSLRNQIIIFSEHSSSDSLDVLSGSLEDFSPV